MDLSRLHQVSGSQWRLEPQGQMRVPAVLFGDAELIAEMDRMLASGARWAVGQGYGRAEDLDRIKERGSMPEAWPDAVSQRAKQRQREEMGTLGSGNHYLEVQEVTAISDETVAKAFGLAPGDIVVSIHCGSRGLGHQIGTDFLREMAIAAPFHGIVLPDLELAYAPLHSELGRRYLGAMRAGINCALANRQIITHLTRRVFAHFFSKASLPVLFDISHYTCTKDSIAVIEAAHMAGLSRKVATLDPVICIKG